MTKPKGTNLYSYTNPHPSGIKSHSDCVYRAISIATGKDWLTVYDELTQLGRELLAPPNDKLTVDTYLDQLAQRKQVRTVGKRPTGKTIARMDPSKIYIMRMAQHLSTVKEGKIRDTWNCSDKAVYTVWEMMP